jgi:NAD-dependent deacetylase
MVVVVVLQAGRLLQISRNVLPVVGTSLVVSPANTLLFYAKNNQAAVVDINPENTPFSYEMDFSIRQTAVEGLSRLMSIFESPF